MNLECWKDIHPGLVTLDMDWDYSIPYGLMYSPKASPDILEFAAQVEKVFCPGES